ncbi:MAG: hypothetical protein MRZ74_01200 [Blautia sp.]|nr:hypothetical protein [Blautia sp.]MDY5032242.1 hypothetical protein [Blautia sp.]
MSNIKPDYAADHFCAVYKRVIPADLCYDSMMCLQNFFKVSSTKELSEITDIEASRDVCRKCKYSEV